ncbi:MAG: molybdopterin molybdotransferase MoeA, partial [Treponema sp.]|nr:molybdopterin molybdotransferase MoeA [Treponema sp.]
PQETGALCAAGITSVSIFAPLTVSIFSTGDELVPPQENPSTGQIRDINTSMLKALAIKNGYNVISTAVFPDDEAQLETAAREAASRSDIVIISGGSSQGEKDFTARIIGSIANPGVFTHGLAVKPGKPAILGWDEDSKTLFAGLPGHPVSAMMIFTLLFSSLKMNLLNFDAQHSTLQTQQLKYLDKFPVPARISCNVPGSPGRSVCLPVALKLENGFYIAEPVFGKAGMISTLTRADGYIIIDLNKEGLKKDEQALVFLL